MALKKAVIRDFERGKQIVNSDPSILGLHFINDGLPPIVVKKKDGPLPTMGNETKGALVPNNVGTPIPTNVKVISQSPVKQDKAGNPIPENTVIGSTDYKYRNIGDKIKLLQTDPVLLPKTQPLKRAEEILTGELPKKTGINFNDKPYVMGAIIIALLIGLYITFKK